VHKCCSQHLNCVCTHDWYMFRVRNDTKKYKNRLKIWQINGRILTGTTVYSDFAEQHTVQSGVMESLFTDSRWPWLWPVTKRRPRSRRPSDIESRSVWYAAVFRYTDDNHTAGCWGRASPHHCHADTEQSITSSRKYYVPSIIRRLLCSKMYSSLQAAVHVCSC